jgi:hypothetical protein
MSYRYNWSETDLYCMCLYCIVYVLVFYCICACIVLYMCLYCIVYVLVLYCICACIVYVLVLYMCLYCICACIVYVLVLYCICACIVYVLVLYMCLYCICACICACIVLYMCLYCICDCIVYVLVLYMCLYCSHKRHPETVPWLILELLCVLNMSETVQHFSSTHRKNKLYIRDTNKCFFDIYKCNIISLLHVSASRQPQGALHQGLKLTKT